MKLFIVIFLALVVQSFAATFIDSLRQPSDYDAEKVFDNILMSAAMDSNSHWQSPASKCPDATAYKTKITNRIESSYVLSSMPNLKERLYATADQKLEKCLTPDGLIKSCVGYSMGQMMQLISATEKNMRYN